MVITFHTTFCILSLYEDNWRKEVFVHSVLENTAGTSLIRRTVQRLALPYIALTTKEMPDERINTIQKCRTSGLGYKDWCEQHGIPISTFYTKITRLRRKACEIPVAKHRIVRESQQVVPLPIIDEVSQPCWNGILFLGLLRQ